MHPTINFNGNILNIFTDASVEKTNDGFNSCSMSLSLYGDGVKIPSVCTFSNSTNNYGELYAIYLGVLSAYYLSSYNEFHAINLFSDSLISIQSLRKWIFDWTVDCDGILKTKSGKVVMNQSIICNIIDMILSFDLPISFYHINGHFKQSELDRFKANMFANNYLKYDIDDDALIKLIYYNDQVDIQSRAYLKNKTNSLFYKSPIEKVFDSNWDLRKYKDLITPKY